MSTRPPKSRNQFPERPNHVEGVGHDPLRGDEPGEDGARDQRDAARVGERDQAERERDAEAVGAHRAEVVRVQRARRAGDQRADAERDQLDVADVDRRPGRGALVGPDGMRWPRMPRRTEMTRSERRTAAASATQPNTGLGRFPSRPRNEAVGPRLMPKSFGSGTGEPVAPGGVHEAEVEDGHRGGDRHHREGHAAHAQRRHRGHEAEQHGGDARERRQREADPGIDGEMRDGEAGDAGERELDDRDLPDEAGDDHQRECHHDADQRVRQRLAEVERQHDERDRAQERRRDRERARVLRAEARRGGAARRARRASAATRRAGTSPPR